MAEKTNWVPRFSRFWREVGSSVVASDGFLNHWRSGVGLRRLTLNTCYGIGKGPEHWKGPTSRNEREKWGTPCVYDARRSGPPAEIRRLSSILCGIVARLALAILLRQCGYSRRADYVIERANLGRWRVKPTHRKVRDEKGTRRQAFGSLKQRM